MILIFNTRSGRENRGFWGGGILMVYTCWGGSIFVRFWLLFATLFLVIFLNFRTPLKLGGGPRGGIGYISDCRRSLGSVGGCVRGVYYK